MRVVLGAVAGTLGGPATYAVELLRALVRCFPEDGYTVLTDRPSAFERVAETVHLPLANAWGQPLWDQLRVPRALMGRGFDLYHGTKGVLPLLTRLPCVVTIHDLAHRLMPETFSRAQRLHLALETPHAIRKAAAVITDSANSAADLARLYPESGGRTEVIPLAAPSMRRLPTVAEVERWKKRFGLDSPCVGYLGTIQPRKNIDMLADAFVAAAEGRDWSLLIAGRTRPGYRPRCLDGGDPRISYLGPLDDDEVATYLASLSCMVSPSSYEGFGLSFIEAMAVGCPVLGFANSSIPEVVGDAGLLLEDRSVGALAEAMVEIITNVELAGDLSRRGIERAALFSWDETARRTHAVYEKVLEERRMAKG